MMDCPFPPGSQRESFRERWRRNTASATLSESLSIDPQSLKAHRPSHFNGSGSPDSWLLLAIIGILTALLAYFVDVSDMVLFDYKYGHCKDHLIWDRKKCCSASADCEMWSRWSETFGFKGFSSGSRVADLAFCSGLGVALAAASCKLTMRTRKNVWMARGSETLCPAAGSGVAEVKLMSRGFELPGYFNLHTLVCKSVAVVLSAASGLSLGKEGPYVHIATCISSAFIEKGERRWLTSTGAAVGLSIAFGAPISGVMFALEEINGQLTPRQLSRIFFCCVMAALSLRCLNPYGTNNIVMFQVHYMIDWKVFEMAAFVILGLSGGILGAMLVKLLRLRATICRRVPSIENNPLIETVVVALITGLLSFWNVYSRQSVTETLSTLATPCNNMSSSIDASSFINSYNPCPSVENIPIHIGSLLFAFLIKIFLTTLTFGIKVPAGIYVPSMVVGALFGKTLGHALQLLIHTFPTSFLFSECPKGHPQACIAPGVYALIGAGAMMCGVTRLPVTLSVALLEITGNFNHLIPFAVAIFASKWVADAVEPDGIYDVVAEMHGYPLLMGDETAATSPITTMLCSTVATEQTPL